VLLATSQQGVQNALIGFQLRASKQAGTKFNTKKTDVLCLTRRPKQCIQQVSGNTLQQVKLMYLSRLPCGGIHELRKSEQKGIDTRITKANAVLLELCCSVVKTGAFEDRKAFSF